MKLSPLRRPSAVALALLIAVACSSGSSPTTPPTTSPTTTVAPGPTPTPGIAGCPQGYGSARFTCQGDWPSLLPNIDVAIDKLVEERPGLFDTSSPAGTGGFLIYDVEAFYAGVIANLQAQGLCAQRDFQGERVEVKQTNEWSENYDMVSSQQRIRRGVATYINSCTPANFPINPEQAVHTVAVSIFRLNCDPGITPPPTGLKQLPMGCIATITATPIDPQGNKVPLELHGDSVSWFFRDGGDGAVVSASPDDEVPFNVRLYPRSLGTFSICAVVRGVQGCLNGSVIP